MNKEKKQKLEAKGWKVTSVTEFLGLTPEEENIIELKLALSAALKNQRIRANLTQASAAKRIRSSQSRVAKMEAGDKSVSLDLMIRSLYGLGINNNELSQIIAPK
jgi:predicted XRE-type DNA-binding protein